MLEQVCLFQEVQHHRAYSTGRFVLHDPEHEALFEKVLQAKNHEALGVSCFTILSIQHCFLYLFSQKYFSLRIV